MIESARMIDGLYYFDDENSKGKKISRYRVEEVPVYDSAEDEPSSCIPETISPFQFESIYGLETDYTRKMEIGDVSGQELDSFNTVKPHNSFHVGGMGIKTEKVKVFDSGKSKEQDMQQPFYQTSEVVSRLRSNSAYRNFHIGSGPTSKKKSQHLLKQKKKYIGGKQFCTKNIAELFQSKEAQEEVHKYEEIKNEAAANLKSVYDEIRPAIEEHERDGQDNVPTSVGEKWVGAHCSKFKADFDFNFSIVKNFLESAKKAGSGLKASGSGDLPKD